MGGRGKGGWGKGGRGARQIKRGRGKGRGGGAQYSEYQTSYQTNRYQTNKAHNPHATGKAKRRQAHLSRRDERSTDKWNRNKYDPNSEYYGNRAAYYRSLKVNDIICVRYQNQPYRAKIVEIAETPAGRTFRVMYEDEAWGVQVVRAQQINVPPNPISASDKIARVIQPSPANRAAIIHLFKHLDATGDGKLNTDDIQGGNPEGAAKFFEVLRYDQNGDQEIDPEEFVDMFMQQAMGAWNAMGGGSCCLVGPNLQSIFDQMQGHFNGFLHQKIVDGIYYLVGPQDLEQFEQWIEFDRSMVSEHLYRKPDANMANSTSS